MWIQGWLTRHVISPGQLLDGNVFHLHPSTVSYFHMSLSTTVFLVPRVVLVAADGERVCEAPPGGRP